ncbi:MAG TPA: type VI secretion system tube protein TssD [Candidatus Acidoferrales bacterium]|nr:type VI secretion system tube protein TssD [Candidatus Acidoferrales bacterium]
MRLKHTIMLAAIAVICLVSWEAMQAHGQPRPMPVQSSEHFHVSILGKKQGQFKGEGIQTARMDKWIPGQRFYSQADQAGGKKTHSPITFTKEWGAASPQIYAALATNEPLSSVVFEFTKTNPSGMEYVYQTITLTNATIVSVKQYIGVSVGGDPPDTRPLEDVSFVFQKIDIENKDGKTMAMDMW